MSDVIHKKLRETPLPRTGRILDAMGKGGISNVSNGSGDNGLSYWVLVTTDSEGNPLPEGAEYIKTPYNVVSENDVVAYYKDDQEEDIPLPIASYTTTGIIQVKQGGGILVDGNGLISIDPDYAGGGGGSIKYPLSWSGYSSGTYDGSTQKNISIPNNTNQLANGAGYITGISLEMVNSALQESGNKYIGNPGNSNFVYIQEDLKIQKACDFANRPTVGNSHVVISTDLNSYVTVATDQTITGAKVFTQNIVSQGDVVAYLGGDITDIEAVASAGTYGLVKIDNNTIKMNASGQIYATGGGGGSGINVIDSLNSTSTTDALSANQGRVLNLWLQNIKFGSIGTYTGQISIGGTTYTFARDNFASISGNRIYINGNYIDVNSGGSTSITYSVTGSGNVVTNVTASGNTVYVTKGNVSADWSGGTITTPIRKDSTNQGFYFGAVSGGWALGCSTSEAWLQAYGNAPTAFYCSNIKRMYIGTSNWSKTNWIIESDMRNKTKVSDFTNVLDKVKLIDVFKYRLNDLDNDKLYIGVSAQQLLNIFPDFVSYVKENDRYAVSYDTMGACIAIQGLKELYSEYLNLENFIKSRGHWEKTKDYEIDQLRKIIADQNLKIKELERRVA